MERIPYHIAQPFTCPRLKPVFVVFGLLQTFFVYKERLQTFSISAWFRKSFFVRMKFLYTTGQITKFLLRVYKLDTFLSVNPMLSNWEKSKHYGNADY